MLISDIFEETFFAVLSNKVRSGLTALGIIIGIASVVTMISIGQGTAYDISTKIESLGSNLLTVSPGATKVIGMNAKSATGSADTLVIGDADAIEEKIQGIISVAPEVSSRQQVIIKGSNTNTNIYGVTETYPQVKNVEIELGTFITENNIRRTSKVAVLGPETRDNLFGIGVNPVGEIIRIGSLDFVVIGVTIAKGGSGFGSSDDLIYIPINTAQHYLTGSDSVNNINIQVEDEEKMTLVEEEITTLLLARHGISNIDDIDFNIMNQADILDTVSEIAGTMTLLLGAIAGISLLVGGIGIMNMMLTTVTERTREIGLRKALGAQNKDIILQFLSESVVLTFVGGVLGILLGWAASSFVMKISDTTTIITTWSIILSFGVSAFIGIVFGYYPARRAASFNPITALRYE
ncbi:MAG: ABC transporter permease [Candidatus Pacebacteria bacterium]|nr:ABC transporter permease [Candidatus Paceibacterota bacterium]